VGVERLAGLGGWVGGQYLQKVIELVGFRQIWLGWWGMGDSY